MVESGLIILAIIFAVLALIFKSNRATIVMTGLVSLVVAGKYLILGLDMAGLGLVAQSLLLCMLLIFVTQGMQIKAEVNKKPKWILGVLFSTLLGAAIYFADLVSLQKPIEHPITPETEWIHLGANLLGQHFLSAELLLLLGFIVLVGLGLNLRKENQK